ncbi:patatin [Nocardioides flavus (ex Wang et al. 2016)]|uniref:Patatin n=1 Tax=Nocardioides flavus (ex Wang et al. 2016) TaxID=2058780 RepID=A0ABQ3HL20_9ACTN|nr:patatin-like phospholipase family protein [Nocardioides flavus (ex Wang et al. 2016)]GHE18402.1 patatin [Nocardioides flavus (ex Wang et al. 2016)]
MTGRGTSALVLGGGGITGIAWELGILAGLAEAGVDLSGADIVVGTSAGSVVGAQVTNGLSLDELYATQLEPPDAELGGRMSRVAALKLLPPYALPGSGRTKLARVGKVAHAAHEPGSVDREGVIRSRLTVHGWPERDLRVTAVDTASGEFTVFTPSSGVDLVSAVAASCAVPTVWPPVEIGGRHYMDGGMRSTANVDVARGAERVVVLAPLPRSISKKTSIRARSSGWRPGRGRS